MRIQGDDGVLGGSCLAERLRHYVRLSDAETLALDGLEDADRSYRRGAVIIRENEAPREMFVVRAGWLHPFSRERLAQLIDAHPRIGALLLGITVAGRVALADRLASIGRTSARARVGALLCEIFARMRRLGLLTEGEGIQLPLTQEDIGDATGLTAVHVNRMIRALAEDGIIERRGGQLHLRDEDRLVSDSNFTDRTGIETGWLPAAR
jgi:CRP/FNR family transcriptional regulator